MGLPRPPIRLRTLVPPVVHPEARRTVDPVARPARALRLGLVRDLPMTPTRTATATTVPDLIHLARHPERDRAPARAARTPTVTGPTEPRRARQPLRARQPPRALRARRTLTPGPPRRRTPTSSQLRRFRLPPETALCRRPLPRAPLLDLRVFPRHPPPLLPLLPPSSQAPTALQSPLSRPRLRPALPAMTSLSSLLRPRNLAIPAMSHSRRVRLLPPLQSSPP